jgi:hypothetical protein
MSDVPPREPTPLEAIQGVLDRLDELTQLGMDVARVLRQQLFKGHEATAIGAAYYKVSGEVAQLLYLTTKIQRWREQAAARSERAARRAAPKPPRKRAPKSAPTRLLPA